MPIGSNRGDEAFARGLMLALLAVGLWGVQFVVGKAAVAAVDPLQVTLIRYMVPTILLLGWLLWREGSAALDYRRQFLPATAVGLSGFTASPLLVFYGLLLTRPEHAAIIIALQPSMTAIADWLLRGRRPAPFTVACLVIAFAGVVAVVTKGQLAFASSAGERLGDFLVLLGAMCWVVYTMATENFRGWSTLRFTVLTLVPGTIGLVVVAALFVPLGWSTIPDAATLAGVGWHLAYLALGGVLVAMLAWNAGNRRIGALNSVLVLNLMPVVTFGIRYLQGHRFAAIEIAGAAMVIGALIANNIYLRARNRRIAARHE